MQSLSKFQSARKHSGLTNRAWGMFNRVYPDMRSELHMVKIPLAAWLTD